MSVKTDVLVLVPALVALWLALRGLALSAFLNIYLPTLLLLPEYVFMAAGSPYPTFHQLVILPIGVAVAAKTILSRQWRASALDVWVGAYVIWTLISHLHNVGAHDLLTTFFGQFTIVVFPYICGKILIKNRLIRTAVCRRFAFLVFLVGLVSVYEFRMSVNPFCLVWNQVFSDQAFSVATQMRWHFGRIKGPYPHAILAGAIIAVAINLHVWLAGTGKWERRFNHMPFPLSKTKAIGIVLCSASLMTFSRGPWLALAFGFGVAALGRSPNSKTAAVRTLSIIVLAGALAWGASKAYLSIGEISEVPEEVSSAAYRSDLLEQYREAVLQRSVWGWGRTTYPNLGSMTSIDNNYLLVALQYGLVGMVLFGLMLVVSSTRLFARAFSNWGRSEDVKFCLTLCVVISVLSISMATVWLGGQVAPILYLFLGWGEGTLLEFRETQGTDALQTRRYGEFEKVLA